MNQHRIATVRRVRNLQERIARSEVARRQQAVAAHERAEAEAWAEVGRRSARPAGASAGFRAHRDMLAGGAADAHRARAAADDAGRALIDAIATWQHEAQRRDGIERLADRAHAEHRAELDRVAANELDDLVVMRRGRERP